MFNFCNGFHCLLSEVCYISRFFFIYDLSGSQFHIPLFKQFYFSNRHPHIFCQKMHFFSSWIVSIKSIFFVACVVPEMNWWKLQFSGNMPTVALLSSRDAGSNFADQWLVFPLNFYFHTGCVTAPNCPCTTNHTKWHMSFLCQAVIAHTKLIIRVNALLKGAKAWKHVKCFCPLLFEGVGPSTSTLLQHLIWNQIA